jgi:tryptophanyl-tRNA synthetase
MLSAIQPTNPLTLGNFVGTMRNWRRFQGEYDSVFFAVDQHAITMRQDPIALRDNTYRLMATFFAAGLEPDLCTLFVQSHVPEHAELAWVLTCNSYMGELNRMTQFKDKSQKQGANIGAGLFVYPSLMAADILLYQAHQVPVGEDQKQHVELTRDIAQRMNNAYQRALFVVPEPFIPKFGARVMSLQEPTKKMSKSDVDPKATIFLTDTNKQIEKKVKGAVTDSGSEITYEPGKAGIKNLIDIQCALLGEAPEAVVARYAGKMYGHLKVDTAQVVIDALALIRDETDRILNDRAELDRMLGRGAEKARGRAQQTLREVYDAIGLIPRR